MPITAECDECHREYRLPDEKAGRKIRCKDCGSVVNVPQRAARKPRPSPARSAPARPVRRPSAKAGRGRSAGKSQPFLKFGAIGSGIVLCIAAGVFFGMKMGGGSTEANVNATAGEAGLTSSGIAEKDLTDEQKALREAEYQVTLEKSRREKSASAHAALVKRFGASKVVTVVFSNVVGETADANRYLNRKIFRAAYKEYEAGRSKASEKTQQNKDQAEQQAVQQHKDKWGNIGPGFVRYRYQQVESDVPYPNVVNAGRLDNVFTFHAAPASNIQQFAQAVGVGQSSINGREIQIAAQLPTPIPDPDVEELVLQFGADQVLKLHVTSATGDPKLVQLYLRNQTISLSQGPSPLSLVGMKPFGNGEYEFHIGPIKNSQVFGERIGWGSVESIDSAERVMTIAASLPEHLPTEQELKAAAAEIKARESAIRNADRAHKPRPGEEEIDWAVRVIVEKDTWGIEKALKALAIMDVDEDRREEISELLCHNLGDHSYKTKVLIPAMLNWKTDRTEKSIITLASGHLPFWDHEIVMEAMVELGTPVCAEALATALTDFSSGDKSVRYLIDIGQVAEDPVLRYLKHQDAKVRSRVYTILMEVGTSTSASKLRTNVKLERTPDMKTLAETCMEEIRARVKEQREAEKGTPSE